MTRKAEIFANDSEIIMATYLLPMQLHHDSQQLLSDRQRRTCVEMRHMLAFNVVLSPAHTIYQGQKLVPLINRNSSHRRVLNVLVATSPMYIYAQMRMSRSREDYLHSGAAQADPQQKHGL